MSMLSGASGGRGYSWALDWNLSRIPLMSSSVHEESPTRSRSMGPIMVYPSHPLLIDQLEPRRFFHPLDTQLESFQGRNTPSFLMPNNLFNKDDRATYSDLSSIFIFSRYLEDLRVRIISCRLLRYRVSLICTSQLFHQTDVLLHLLG